MLLTVKSAAAEDEQAVVALWRACDLVARRSDRAPRRRDQHNPRLFKVG
jgi:hypothetical protein